MVRTTTRKFRLIRTEDGEVCADGGGVEPFQRPSLPAAAAHYHQPATCDTFPPMPFVPRLPIYHFEMSRSHGSVDDFAQKRRKGLKIMFTPRWFLKKHFLGYHTTPPREVGREWSERTNDRLSTRRWRWRTRALSSLGNKTNFVNSMLMMLMWQYPSFHLSLTCTAQWQETYRQVMIHLHFTIIS